MLLMANSKWVIQLPNLHCKAFTETYDVRLQILYANKHIWPSILEDSLELATTIKQSFLH